MVMFSTTQGHINNTHYSKLFLCIAAVHDILYKTVLSILVCRNLLNLFIHFIGFSYKMVTTYKLIL